MIKHSHTILIATALILLLAGCAKESDLSKTCNITIEATIGQMTKMSHSADGIGTSFTAGDKIAVYGWIGGADKVPTTRLVDGVVNTLGTDGKWTPESQMLWKPGTDKHYFLGVFPARTITDFAADDYTLDPSKYTESDLLIAKEISGITPTNVPIDLEFTHAMAKLVVNMKFRNQWDSTPDVSGVTVSARSAAKVNYLTKEVKASGDVSEVGLTAESSAPDGYALTYSGLQVPQEGVRKVTVTIGTKEYLYESETDIPLVSGQYTTLGLVIGKEKIELTGIKVSDWEAEAALPDGEARYIVPVTASNYLTFTSEGTTTISLNNEGGNAPKLYYSTDAHNWTEWDYSELTFTSSAPLYICGDNPDGISAGFYKKSFFADSGSNYSVSGDIMSLLNKDDAIKVIPSESCFCGLFEGCTGLTAAPKLPATTLATRCYSNMFNGCTSLTVAPELPATMLENYCYECMFYGCSSLTEAPELKAKTLVAGCYSYMFKGCIGLTVAPELPAKTLTEICYNYMFSGCTKLNYVKCLATNISANNCTFNWLNGVAPSGTFIKAEGMNNWPSGAGGIPNGWTVPEAVDLGLSVKWATCNVGAVKPEDYGSYFAWGETAANKKNYTWSTLQYCMDDSGKQFSKYIPSDQAGYWGGAGSPDNRTVLEAGDDAATANWGAPWRMPTYAEWIELITKCTWTWIDKNGLKGYFVSNNNNEIFLPVAGRRIGTNLNSADGGFYWSSSLYTFLPSIADIAYFDSEGEGMNSTNRCNGLSVRPVTE